MSNKYLCVHCDKSFEHEGDKKPRCPECMRVNSLEKIDAPKTATDKKNHGPTLAALALMVAVAGGGYAYWSSTTPATVSGDVPRGPLSYSEFTGHIQHRGVDYTKVEKLFEAGSAVAALSKKTASDATAGVTELRKSQNFIPWSVSRSRKQAPRMAEQAAATMLKSGGRAKLYPFEVALAVTAALREAGTQASVAEIFAYDGEKAPLDPSGLFGYFGVAVGEGDSVKIADPYGGRTSAPKPDAFRVLNDVQVAAAYLGHLAAYKQRVEGLTQDAFNLSSDAIKLDGTSANLRSNHGAIVSLATGTEPAIEEFKTASQIRHDSPRRIQMARIAMSQQNLEAARTEITAALTEHPEYADAHAVLALTHLASRETDEARLAINKAEKFDPDLPAIPMVRASLLMADGDVEAAIAQVRRALEYMPHNWQLKIQAAMAFRAAGNFDEMRRLARSVRDAVPAGQRAIMEQRLLQFLGPTALEEPLDLDTGVDDVGGDDTTDIGDTATGGGFQLKGSSLLGETDDPDGLGLLGEDESLDLGGLAPNQGGGLQLGLGGGASNGPKLKLQD